ncbi:MAG: choice-of-anchor L domain-containing protein [Flavobacteriales bacterium]
MMKLPTPAPIVRMLGAIGLLMAHAPATAQLVITQTQSPDTLVKNVLLGPDVAFSNVFFNGRPGNTVAPVLSGLSEIGRFNGTHTSIGMGGGLFLCTGVARAHLPGPNDRLSSSSGTHASTSASLTPDLDLSRLTGWPRAEATDGANIYNSSILEFDFVPLNDMISFRYVFSSEEYERWACSQYDDVFGWFISGPGISGPFTNNAMNIAFIPGSMKPVSINTVNSGRLDASNANGPVFTDLFGPCFAADPNWRANAQYYRYNGGQWPSPVPQGGVAQLEAPYNTDPYYIQHNGMTVVLTASAAVLIGETYHMKMGVGNVNDDQFPSAAFIEGGSFKSADRFSLTVDERPNVDLSGTDPILHESQVDSVYLRFNRWGGFYLDEYLPIAVEGDAIPGLDYLPSLPDSIHFDQLDSAVVLPLAIPVRSDEARQLNVSLITSNGNKVQTYHLEILPQIAMAVDQEVLGRISLFPSPVESTLHVALPADMVGRTELQVLDVSGRVMMHQVLLGSPTATLDLGHLPNGLYVLKAYAQGRVATERVSVRH